MPSTLFKACLPRPDWLQYAILSVLLACFTQGAHAIADTESVVCTPDMAIAQLEARLDALRAVRPPNDLPLAHCHHLLASAQVAQLHSQPGNHDHFSQDEWPLQNYERAIKIYRQHPPSAMYAQALQQKGRLFAIQGEWHDAIRASAKSVALYAELTDIKPLILAQATNDLAQINFDAGLLELARIHAQNAQELCEQHQLGMADCQAAALTVIGDTFVSAGDYFNAMHFFETVNNGLATELGARHLRTLASSVRLRLAQSQLRADLQVDQDTIGLLQHYLAALDAQGQALSTNYAQTLENLALLQLKTNTPKTALLTIQQALALREKIQGVHARILGATLVIQAKILLADEQIDAMRQPLFRAFAMAWGYAPQAVKSDIFALLSQYMKRTNKLHAAVFFAKRASEMALQSGREIRLANQTLGRNIVAVRSNVFRQLISSLFELNRLVEAQDALDLLKENEFLDFATEQANVMRTAEHNEFEAPWKDRMYLLQDRYGEVTVIKEKNRLSANSLDLDDLKQLYQSLEDRETRFTALLKEIEHTFSGAEASKQKAAQESQDALAQKTALLQKLGHGAVMLQYFVDGQTLYILLTTDKGLKLHKVSLKTSRWHDKINQFLSLLQNPRRDPVPLARELYQLLLAPVAQDLAANGARTIMFSMDGVLHRVPLAALHDGKQYLVQKFDLALVTQPDMKDLTKAPAKEIKIGGLGLSRAIGNFRALPGVKRELNGIIKTDAASSEGLLPGEKLFDDAFTATTLQSMLARQWPVLHIASHFVMQANGERPSFLLLGDGQQLSLEQLKEKRFDFSRTDLLTLSACDTAVGAENANGLAIEGMGVILQNRGAKSILATKWSIEDQSTALLMRQFYQNWARGQTKASALRMAQSAFITKETNALPRRTVVRGIKRVHSDTGKPFKPERRYPYAHPYYWAAFVLMGNWL